MIFGLWDTKLGSHIQELVFGQASKGILGEEGMLVTGSRPLMTDSGEQVHLACRERPRDGDNLRKATPTYNGYARHRQVCPPCCATKAKSMALHSPHPAAPLLRDNFTLHKFPS